MNFSKVYSCCLARSWQSEESREQSDENFSPSLLRLDLKHDGSQKPKDRKLKNFSRFHFCCPTRKWRSEEVGESKILREAELKIFQTLYVAFLSFLSFALGGARLRSLTNAPSSIFIEKVRTFSTLAGISNIDFFEMPDSASIKENVGFRKVEEPPSHFLSSVKMRKRRKPSQKIFMASLFAAQREDDGLKKSKESKAKIFSRYCSCSPTLR